MLVAGHVFFLKPAGTVKNFASAGLLVVGNWEIRLRRHRPWMRILAEDIGSILWVDSVRLMWIENFSGRQGYRSLTCGSE